MGYSRTREGYKTYSIAGNTLLLIYLGTNNIFGYPYCENDRLWRRMLGMGNAHYISNVEEPFDECHNAYV